MELGSVYTFVSFDGGWTWSENQKFIAADGATEARFGGSLAIYNNTIVVGAYLDDHGGQSNPGKPNKFAKQGQLCFDCLYILGSVYVYGTEDGMVWSEDQKLVASDHNGEDHFGYSVVLHDGTVVVGARYEDNVAGNNAGIIFYLYVVGCNIPRCTLFRCCICIRQIIQWLVRSSKVVGR